MATHETILDDSPRIKRLPEKLINQIAAGEVIDRPASIIKELVENSIDAGATRVEVNLKNGGIDEIEIIDDGIGMGARDLALSIERHATSKISEEADLENVATYGFRGEALSSISSVAEVELLSRLKTSAMGHKLQVEFGEAQELVPKASSQGTRISVKKLFSCTYFSCNLIFVGLITSI